MEKCSFSGWATRNDLLCSDGRTIRQNAFKDDDGKTVPVIWMHKHGDPEAVLGHAVLENRSEGVYAYVYLNDTKQGKNAKTIVEHGDVRSLSIYANKLKQIGNDVIHGSIKELSLVLAGANPGAYIDAVMAHSEDDGECALVNYDESALMVYPEEVSDIEHSETEKEEKPVAEETKKEQKTEEDKTVQDVFDSMTEEQQNVTYYMIEQALEMAAEDSAEHSEIEEGDDVMKKNVFDQEETRGTGVLSHSDQEAILKMAKSSQVGTFQSALELYAEEYALQHADEAAPVGGFQQTGAEGELTIDALFPDYKDVKSGAPELITNDQGWISVVMSKVHKSPISRIRTGQVDIRNIDALRAKGYKKGEAKKYTGNFKLVRRTTDPQTVYVKNALHRDDIIDITDFDYVSYLYKIDRMMLDEELATAIMFGDNREEGDPDKIYPEHIRPIWTDDDLYTQHVTLDLEEAAKELQGTDTNTYFGKNFIRAEAMVNTVLYARENYKGSGTPDMYIDPHELNVMLLARDRDGRRIYSSKAELAAALNVANIYTAEQMRGKTRKDTDGKSKKLLCMIVNLADYTLGATKGGEVTHFTQFDIDFNQEKSLLETRCSGALTKVYSAIAIEELVEEAAG